MTVRLQNPALLGRVANRELVLDKLDKRPKILSQTFDVLGVRIEQALTLSALVVRLKYAGPRLGRVEQLGHMQSMPRMQQIRQHLIAKQSSIVALGRQYGRSEFDRRRRQRGWRSGSVELRVPHSQADALGGAIGHHTMQHLRRRKHNKTIVRRWNYHFFKRKWIEDQLDD